MTDTNQPRGADEPPTCPFHGVPAAELDHIIDPGDGETAEAWRCDYEAPSHTFRAFPGERIGR